MRYFDAMGAEVTEYVEGLEQKIKVLTAQIPKQDREWDIAKTDETATVKSGKQTSNKQSNKVK